MVDEVTRTIGATENGDTIAEVVRYGDRDIERLCNEIDQRAAELQRRIVRPEQEAVYEEKASEARRVLKGEKSDVVSEDAKISAITVTEAATGILKANREAKRKKRLVEKIRRKAKKRFQKSGKPEDFEAALSDLSMDEIDVT